MDTTTHHTMHDLFDQLGLPSDPAGIRHFLRLNSPMPDTLCLADAPFWSDSQAGFLREQVREDGDWAMMIDALNARLHEHPDVGTLPQSA